MEANCGPRGRQARGAAAIPQFFFPDGRPVPEEVLAAAAARVDALLAVYSGGLTIPGMKQLVKEVRLCVARACRAVSEAVQHDARCMVLRGVSKHRLLSGLFSGLFLACFFMTCQCCVQVCELPSVLAYPLFYKLITPGETTVSHSAVRTWLAQRQITQVRQIP